MSSFKKFDGMLDDLQKQASGKKTLAGSAIEDFLSIAGYEEPQGSGGGGYDAVIKLTHANNTSDDSPSTLTPTIISGTYAGISAKLDNGEIPVILICYEYSYLGYKWEMPLTVFTYYAPNANPPYYQFLPCGAFIKNNDMTMTVIDDPLTWNANDELMWD